MRNIAIAIALLIAAATNASAQQKPAIDTAKIDADIVKAFPTAPAARSPSLTAVIRSLTWLADVHVA